MLAIETSILSVQRQLTAALYLILPFQELKYMKIPKFFHRYIYIYNIYLLNIYIYLLEILAKYPGIASMSIHEKPTVLIVDNINIYTHTYIYAYLSNRYSLKINFIPYHLEHHFLH